MTSYTVLSERPLCFETEQPVPCDDCGEPVSILTDTIAGYLCDDCSKRLCCPKGCAND
jgi:hypothetical protein